MVNPISDGESLGRRYFHVAKASLITTPDRISGENMSYTLGEAQAQVKCLHMAHWLTNCANRCIIINSQEVINTLWYGRRVRLYSL